MKNNRFNLFALIIVMLLTSPILAQDGMEEYFYQSGKIKVVVVVAMLVLTGIFIFLFTLNRKLGKLERRIEEGNKK